jgi:16S rRNA (guanine527-N7)-methyltransferase
MDTLAQATHEMLDVRLSEGQLRAFQTYADELATWNRRVNLTAIISPQAVEMRHFLDSLSCLLVLQPASGLRIIDVGTGAGFPGIPIKIAYPEVHLTLLEATGKKVAFLEHLVSCLGLEGVTLVNARAEEVGQQEEHRESYDWVLARAVAGMRVLAEYVLPLCRLGGHCLAQKGEDAPQEVTEAQETIGLLGGRVNQLTSVELPTVAETRYLVDIAKIAATPPTYPRRPGRPAKRPL